MANRCLAIVLGHRVAHRSSHIWISRSRVAGVSGPCRTSCLRASVQWDQFARLATAAPRIQPPTRRFGLRGMWRTPSSLGRKLRSPTRFGGSRSPHQPHRRPAKRDHGGFAGLAAARSILVPGAGRGEPPMSAADRRRRRASSSCARRWPSFCASGPLTPSRPPGKYERGHGSAGRRSGGGRRDRANVATFGKKSR